MMTTDNKLNILKLAISLYPCPPFNGENIDMNAHISPKTGSVSVKYINTTAYWHISNWRDKLCVYIGFKFSIYEVKKLL